MSLSAKCPTLLVCHDIAWHHNPGQVPGIVQKYYEYFVPQFLSQADHVVTVSDYVRRDIHKTFSIDLNQTSVVYNGVKPEFQPLSLLEQQAVKAKHSSDKPYFLFVGSMHPRKNLVRLIEAFAIFKQNLKSEHKLLLVGKMGWQTSEIKDRFESSAFKDDICFLGYQEQSELVRLTAAAHALCFVSLEEGFGVPMIEALYCDVPVIASNTSCMPEIAGDAALYVDPLDPDDIADKLAQISQDSELRHKLIQNGQQQRQRYSWDRSAQQMLTIMSRLLES